MILFFVGTAFWFLFWAMFLASTGLRVSAPLPLMTLFHSEASKR